MTTILATDPLEYYAKAGAALFPIPAGSKAPFGIVASFKHDFSRSPEQWRRWQTENPGCNFGVVAFASGWIIVDIDTSGGDAGRNEAWALWCDLCDQWGIPEPLQPHVQSARGGWHCYFQVPAGVDASQLRQPDAIKKRINIRCVGFTVAAGSYFLENETPCPYLLLSDAPPHPAPAPLLQHCTRAPARPNTTTLPGSRDKGDVAALLLWLNEHDAFESYEDWFQIGMALRLEYGDDGFDLWEMTHDGTVSPETATSKWSSFATEPTKDSVTLNSFLDRAHKLGWRGSVRKSSAAMFDGVAQLAAASGASLSGMVPSQGVPMLAGQLELARLAAPILAEFLQAVPFGNPTSSDFPTLPDAMEGHGLFAQMQDTIARIIGLAEGTGWKPARVTAPLAVLSLLHADVYSAVVRRVEALGHTVYGTKVRLAAANLSEKVERITVTQDKWEYDQRGEPQGDNSDNVAVLLGVLSLELRWNGWLERMEIQGGIDADVSWPKWTHVDDTVVAKLRTRANRTKTRFRPGKEFLWETLLSLAHGNTVDPALDLLSRLEAEWDGTPRPDWLSVVAGVPDDVYHRAVARSLVGGMVKRMRHPGVKFDTMPVFFGRQGTGKSTMLSILALGPEYFSDSILLGDASKELVLSLAGKTLVEISEMGMRGNTNVNHVKAMISRTTDAGRTAYARAVTERPRRNIWAGSTNDTSPLVDTENRRFLPVAIEDEIDLPLLRTLVGQIVGEMAAAETRGEDFSIPRAVWQEAATHQEAARSVSDMEARLTDWFSEGPFTTTAFVTTHDLAELAAMVGWNGQHTLRAAVLRRLGFSEKPCYVEGRKTRAWYRGPAAMGRHIAASTRYRVGRTADGRPRVTIERGAVSEGAPEASRVPPLPY